MPIYLDHHSTTPCDPRVVDAMAPYWTREFGNAASRTHAFGWRAEEAVEAAREEVARLIGADPREIVFTSGATESNNLALLGVARASRERGDHIISCRTEHRSVLDPLAALEKEGFRVTRLAVDAEGLVDVDDLRAALDGRTILVSVMHVNNEIGVVQPLPEIARVTREHGALFHTDAAQSVGKLMVDVDRLGVDLLSLTAHKLYGPKGMGALYVRRRSPVLRVAPILYGGGHERGMRSGTLPVALCVGLGRACQIAGQEWETDAKRVLLLRDRLWQRLSTELDEVWLNGHPENRVAGNLNLSFIGVEAQALLVALPEVALSSGSACTSAQPQPSHVIRALGRGGARALGAVRFGIGRANTEAEIDAVAELLVEQVERLRAMSPLWREPARAPSRS
ncbi:MAG: aminotransferase class V-fold PLP-dependent enzyme [Deltaproteobacteria bacterium]|nr:aminotransferase class V-fold PLP-dependent enzyme [Deltaproteobacteria bacterium]